MPKDSYLFFDASLKRAYLVQSRSRKMDHSAICEFYAGQTIFLTGGTGFLGKVLVEKLLRTCDPKTLYLLVRDKKGKTKEERFEDYFNVMCFDNLKSMKPDYKSKVKLISGDISKADLGISTEDVALLTKEVTCLIHMAANIRFDQFIREAAYINVRSAKGILDLAKQMTHLVSFVYVSTAYSNCSRNFICEKVYDPPLTAPQLLTILDMLDDETLERITPDLLGEFPNTYVYTKNIAEAYFHAEKGNLPLTIVRPGIIHSALKEPVPGWNDELFALIGVLAASGLGVLRNIHAEKNSPAWLVPVDQTASIIIAAGWEIARRNTSKSDCCERIVPVYNFVGSVEKYFTYGEVERLGYGARFDVPISMTVWFPTPNFHANYYWYRICTFTQQMVPAYLADVVFGCLGKPKMAVKRMRNVIKMADLMSYFMRRHLYFQTDNVKSLWDQLEATDKEIFDFDVKKIFDEKYFLQAMVFGKEYILKDPVENVPYARRKLQFLCALHYAFLVMWYYLLFKLFMFFWHLLF